MVRTYDDLKVAGVAAFATVGLTLALRYGLEREVSFVIRLIPLYIYFGYIFARERDVKPPYGLAQPWMAFILLVTSLIGLAYYFIL